MSKNVILLYDSNTTFTKGFYRFLSGSPAYELYIIESLDEIESYQYDYLLIDSSLKDRLKFPDHRVFYLVNDTNATDKKNICRYQNARQILAQLEESSLAYEKESKIISLFSMAGGTGKTVFAQALCQALSTIGKKSMYISFSLCNPSLDKDIDLSLLMYYLYNHQEIPPSTLKTIDDCIASNKGQINAFINRPEDRSILTEETLKALNDFLHRYAGERTLIIELPWGSGNRLKTVCRYAHYNVLLTDQRHHTDLLKEWTDYYIKEIGDEKTFYQIQNKVGGNMESRYVLPVFDEASPVRGIATWIGKNLLTQWMK